MDLHCKCPEEGKAASQVADGTDSRGQILGDRRLSLYEVFGRLTKS